MGTDKITRYRAAGTVYLMSETERSIRFHKRMICALNWAAAGLIVSGLIAIIVISLQVGKSITLSSGCI